jgi:outer membrane protein OmpA-like peptidoglycan-associated protein
MLKIFKINIYILVLLLTTWLSTEEGMTQVRSGAAFLKMMPGARIQSMAGAATAMFDDPHAVFANPAAAAHFREWEWSAGYTKWIADISNASFIYGRRIPAPWSRDFRVGFGLLYQGTSSFNNNLNVLPEASASDVVASISLGQPLSFISDILSVGTNIKYMNSILAQYSASSIIFDYGIMAKSAPVKIGKSMRGVFSLGAAITQNGPDLTFIQMGTPLPQTIRFGGAAYLGLKNNVKMLLSADYVSVKDEDPFLSIGSEFRLNRLLAVNAGYDFGSELFNKITLGASIRLDDVSLPVGDAFPGKHNAFRIDVATLDGSEFFTRTYRGTVTHFASRPEPFKLVTPVRGDSITSSNVMLRWQQAREKDIFDNVTYRVLVDRDSVAIARIINACDRNPELYLGLLENPLIMNKETTDNFLPMGISEGGDYYWTVAAVDKDQQVRFSSGENAISNFTVTRSDIELRDIQFDYNPYITMDDYHGLLKVKVRNNGDHSAHNLTIRLQDDVEQLDYNIETLAFSGDEIPMSGNRVEDLTIVELLPGELREVEMEWRTTLLGRHKISAQIDPDGQINELNRLNNSMQKSFYTVPKGSFSAVDETPIVSTASKIVETPLITKIAFEKNSTILNSLYVDQKGRLPVLRILAERLRKNPQLSIQLEGVADSNSNETNTALADSRAEAVKNSLMQMDVLADQINIAPGRVLSARMLPPDSADAEMLRQERRYVEISAPAAGEAILFRPVEERETTIEKAAIQFSSDVASAISFSSGEALFVSNEGQAKQYLNLENKNSTGKVSWRLPPDMSPDWLDQDIDYSMSIQDSLGRSFQTSIKTMRLKQQSETKHHVISVPLQFGEKEPPSEAVWHHVLETAVEILQDSTMRVRVEGHACAIGANDVNQKLSTTRAIYFDQKIRDYLKSGRDKFSADAFLRIDRPVGFGEARPLVLQESIKNAISGSFLDRQLSRRIELVFYKAGDKF